MKNPEITALKEQIKKNELRPVKTYWWNFRRKTNDFNGTLKDLLKKWNIKVSLVEHPSSNDKYPNPNPQYGYRFKMPVGSSIIQLDTFGEYNYLNASLSALKLAITYLGDKAILTDGYKTIYINH